MADGFSASTASAILNAIFRAAAYSETALWVQAHVGAPGPNGTSNIAGETTRVDATAAFGTAAASGSISNTAVLTWSSVSTAETWSHISVWSASTGGSFICSGSVTPTAVGVGDDVSIPVGDVNVSIPVAS